MTDIVSGGALNSIHSFVFSGATLPLKVVVTSSVARIWCQGRQDDGGAEGAEPSAKRRVGWCMGRGVTSQPTMESGERRELPMEGSGRMPGLCRIFCMF